MKVHDSASFNIYVCTVSWRIVFDRLDHISYMHEVGAGSPADELRQVGRFLPPVSGRFKVAYCLNKRLISKDLFHLHYKKTISSNCI